MQCGRGSSVVTSGEVDKNDLAQLEQTPLEERNLPASSYALLKSAATQWPEGRALRLLSGGAGWESSTDWTYSEFFSRVTQTANALNSLGLGRNDPIALLGPNSGALLASVIAAETVGIAMPINPLLAPERILGLLTTSGARAIIVAGPEISPDLWSGAIDLAAHTGIPNVLALRPDGSVTSAPVLTSPPSGVHVTYLETLAASESKTTLNFAPPSSEDIAAYFHTGGTTGAPKLAAHTQGNQISTAWSVATALELNFDETILAGLPLFHVNGLIVTGLAPLFRGNPTLWIGPLGFRDPAFFAHVWKIIERYSVRAMSAVPTVYAKLSQVPVDADISSLSFCAVGASMLPPNVRESFRIRTGIELTEGYGLTEATCASVVGNLDFSRQGTIGRRLPYQRVAAFTDVDGVWQQLAPGVTGVIGISGPSVFPGYIVRDGDQRRIDPLGTIRDGWLNTGDLGSVDEDGYLTLRGRVKDLIIRGGHNIDPATIEASLLEHPEVMAAAAVGRPDAISGEVPVAYVVTSVDPDELLQWLQTRITEKGTLPKALYPVSEIVLTEVGKPFKPALREDATLRAMRDQLGDLASNCRFSVTHHDGSVVVRIEDPVNAAAIRQAAAELGVPIL